MDTIDSITNDKLIQYGHAILGQNEYNEISKAYVEWKNIVQMYVVKNGFSKEIQNEVKVKGHFIANEFSEAESIKNIKTATEGILRILENLDKKVSDDLSEETAKLIIERILSHVNIYLKSMYYDRPHKKSTFSEEILHQIKIENEYDVQHVLYSLLRTVFPEIRKEVNGDNGYSGIRADLYLASYDVTIEIKCTRESMSEKQLTEELGADAFHYKTKNLYLFIYDKEDIIKNPEAYQMAFYRSYDKFGKNVKGFIIKP